MDIIPLISIVNVHVQWISAFVFLVHSTIIHGKCEKLDKSKESFLLLTELCGLKEKDEQNKFYRKVEDTLINK